MGPRLRVTASFSRQSFDYARRSFPTAHFRALVLLSAGLLSTTLGLTAASNLLADDGPKSGELVVSRRTISLKQAGKDAGEPVDKTHVSSSTISTTTTPTERTETDSDPVAKRTVFLETFEAWKKGAGLGIKASVWYPELAVASPFASAPSLLALSAVKPIMTSTLVSLSDDTSPKAAFSSEPKKAVEVIPVVWIIQDAHSDKGKERVSQIRRSLLVLGQAVFSLDKNLAPREVRITYQSRIPKEATPAEIALARQHSPEGYQTRTYLLHRSEYLDLLQTETAIKRVSEEEWKRLEKVHLQLKEQAVAASAASVASSSLSKLATPFTPPIGPTVSSITTSERRQSSPPAFVLSSSTVKGAAPRLLSQPEAILGQLLIEIVAP